MHTPSCLSGNPAVAALAPGRCAGGSIRPVRLAPIVAAIVVLHAAASAGYLANVPADQQQSAAPTGKLLGQVVNPDGSPAAATVWAVDSDNGPLKRLEVTADAKGRYLLELPPGRWRVWSSLGTKGGEAHSGSRIVVADGQVTELAPIKLEERGNFRGLLLEAETGKPIAGGKLFLDNGMVITTDAAGKFEIGGLTREGHDAYIVASGRLRTQVLFDTTAKADTYLEVAVPAGVKITGKVTGLDGKPIAGAFVHRPEGGSTIALGGSYERCNEAGRFEYDGLRPEWPVEVIGAAPGHFSEYSTKVTVTAKAKPPELHIQLRPKPATNDAKLDKQKWRTVSGVVRGPDDKPVADVTIRWDYRPRTANTIQTATDKAGIYRLTVPNEAGMLAVLPREHLLQFPEVPAGGDKMVDVKLKPGHEVRGRIRDDKGKPVAGVWVFVETIGPERIIFSLDQIHTRTNDEGKFVVKGVPQDAWFSVVKPGLSHIRNLRLPLDKEEDAVWITMERIGAVTGKVVDLDGKPIRNFCVYVDFPRQREKGDKYAGIGRSGVQFTSDDGTFVLSGVPAGSFYRLIAVADDHGHAIVDRVKAVPVNHLQDAVPATLKAGPLIALRVQAVGPEGKPVSNAEISLINGRPQLDVDFMWGYDERPGSLRAKTKADGWADFPKLRSGEATVLVRAPGFARQKIAWRKGEAEIKFQLAPQAVLVAEVRDATGKPLEKYYVTLEFSTEKTAFVPATSDLITGSADSENKGQCRLDELPTGQAKVTILDANSRTIHTQTASFSAGRTTNLQIQLKEK